MWRVPCRMGRKAFLICAAAKPWPLTLHLTTRYLLLFSCGLLHSMLPDFPPLGLCQWYFFCLGFPTCLLCTLNSYSYFDTLSKVTSYTVSSPIYTVHQVCLCFLRYHIVGLHAPLTKCSLRAGTPTLVIFVYRKPNTASSLESEPSSCLCNGRLSDVWGRTLPLKREAMRSSWSSMVGWKERGALPSVWLQFPTRVPSGYCCLTSWSLCSVANKLTGMIHNLKK